MRTFPAPLAEHGSPPYAEMSAALDSAGRVHVAWIRDDGASQDLVYSVIDGDGITTTPVTQTAPAAERYPSLVLDGSDHPHIAYFVRRDPAVGIRSGNFAVYYATDPEGDGSFAIEQVSTNPTTPTDDTTNVANAYVNGRPQVALTEAGGVVVNYMSDFNSAAGDVVTRNEVILATRTGASTWTHERFFRSTKTMSVDWAFAMPRELTADRHVAWIDISDYAPRFFRGASSPAAETVVTGYDSIFGNKHAQLARGSDGALHLFWWHDGESTGDTEAVMHTAVSGAGYSTPEPALLPRKRTGNLLPAAVDASDDAQYYAYLASNGDLYLAGKPKGAAQFVEFGTDRLGGSFVGHRVLDARDGKIAAVLGDFGDDELIVITADATSFQ